MTHNGELDIFHVDVFTDTAFGGNPASVVLWADSLDDEMLQKIAREMNRCIHCRRCIRLAEEYLGVQHIGLLNRVDHLEIGSHI